MTITLRLIRETDTGAIGQAADAWGQLAAALDDRLDEFTADSRDLPGVWPSGADAGRRAGTLRREIADVHEPCQRISRALRTHADALWQLKGMLDGILSECAGNGVRVDLASGTVSATPGTVTGTAQAARIPGLVDGYTAQLRDLLARAGRMDADTRAVLAACLPVVGSGFGAAGGPATPVCPTDELLGRPPAEVHDWWIGLTRSQQDRMIQDFPRQVGGLDGIPADDRDKANRLALERQKEEVLARMAVERGNLPGLREQMQRITKVEEALGRLGDRGYLLAVDTEAYGGHGKVADAKFAEPWDKILFPGAAPAVWAVETAADATHGDAPTSGGFGGNNWRADTGGHTSYWEPDSESLNNQARVLAGRYDKVTLNSGTIPEAIR